MDQLILFSSQIRNMNSLNPRLVFMIPVTDILPDIVVNLFQLRTPITVSGIHPHGHLKGETESKPMAPLSGVRLSAIDVVLPSSSVINDDMIDIITKTQQQITLLSINQPTNTRDAQASLGLPPTDAPSP